MDEKTVVLNYSLTLEHAVSAMELSGEKKQRMSRNRNTTVWLAVIIAIFGTNIITALTKKSEINSSYVLYTSIFFIVLCCILIAITWLGGISSEKAKLKGLSDGTEYKVFINQNGVSYIFGKSEEVAIPRGDFLIKSNDLIYLIIVNSEMLIIPKTAIPDGDTETVREYLL